MTDDALMNDRRLSDRILHALELALDEGELEVASHLGLALEEALTHFGGPDKREKRDLPNEMLEAFARLDAMKHAAVSPS